MKDPRKYGVNKSSIPKYSTFVNISKSLTNDDEPTALAKAFSVPDPTSFSLKTDADDATLVNETHVKKTRALTQAATQQHQLAVLKERSSTLTTSTITTTTTTATSPRKNVELMSDHSVPFDGLNKIAHVVKSSSSKTTNIDDYINLKTKTKIEERKAIFENKIEKSSTPQPQTNNLSAVNSKSLTKSLYVGHSSSIADDTAEKIQRAEQAKQPIEQQVLLSSPSSEHIPKTSQTASALKLPSFTKANLLRPSKAITITHSSATSSTMGTVNSSPPATSTPAAATVATHHSLIDSRKEDQLSPSAPSSVPVQSARALKNKKENNSSDTPDADKSIKQSRRNSEITLKTSYQQSVPILPPPPPPLSHILPSKAAITSILSDTKELPKATPKSTLALVTCYESNLKQIQLRQNVNVATTKPNFLFGAAMVRESNKALANAKPVSVENDNLSSTSLNSLSHTENQVRYTFFSFSTKLASYYLEKKKTYIIIPTIFSSAFDNNNNNKNV